MKSAASRSSPRRRTAEHAAATAAMATAGASAARRPAVASGRRPRAGSERIAGSATCMVAPAVVLLLAVTAYPLAYNLWNSFHAENLSEITRAGRLGRARQLQPDVPVVGVAGRAAAHARVRRCLGRDRDRARARPRVDAASPVPRPRAVARRGADPVGCADGRLGDVVEDDVRPALRLRRLHLRPAHHLARRHLDVVGRDLRR